MPLDPFNQFGSGALIRGEPTDQTESQDIPGSDTPLENNDLTCRCGPGEDCHLCYTHFAERIRNRHRR